MNYTPTPYKISFKDRRVCEMQNEHGFNTKEVLDSRLFDSFWKGFSDYHQKEVVSYFVPKEVLPLLDLDKITTGNKEQQFFFRHVVGVPRDQTFLDKLYQVPFKDVPNKYFVLHLEFQTNGNLVFTIRMADYMLLRNLTDKSITYSMAIVGHKEGEYSNKYMVGTIENGIVAKFEDHIIKDLPESTYQRKGCIVSHALHAVWMQEHKNQFTQKELQEKYYKICQNVTSFEFDGTKYVSIILFVLKYALDCIPDTETFGTFVRKVLNLTPKISFMTIFEEIEANGKAKGIEIGAERTKVEMTKAVVKNLIDNAKLSLKEIAQTLNITVSKVKEIKAMI